VLGYVMNIRPAGIGLVGTSATSVGRATAQALGCEIMHTTKDRGDGYEVQTDITAACELHNWPLLLELQHVTPDRRLAWLTSPHEKPVVYATTGLEAIVLGMQHAWRIISHKPAMYVPRGILSAGRHVMPHWLRDLMGRQLKLKSDAEILSFRVLDDMIHWLSAFGVPAAPEAARDLIDDVGDEPGAAADRFVAIMQYFIARGEVQFIQPSHTTRNRDMPTIYRLTFPGPNGIFIAKSVLNKLLANAELPLVDIQAVSRSLASAGALVTEIEYAGGSGWLLVESWWAKHLEARRVLQSRQLRIVG
jgi:hypothetical protein